MVLSVCIFLLVWLKSMGLLFLRCIMWWYCCVVLISFWLMMGWVVECWLLCLLIDICMVCGYRVRIFFVIRVLCSMMLVCVSRCVVCIVNRLVVLGLELISYIMFGCFGLGVGVLEEGEVVVCWVVMVWLKRWLWIEGNLVDLNYISGYCLVVYFVD